MEAIKEVPAMTRSEQSLNSLLLILLISLLALLSWSVSMAHGKAPALFAVGDNTSGQLGDGTTGTDRPTPGRVENGNGVKALSAGANHSLYVKEVGSLWAVGKNHEGQLGIGSTVAQSTPVQVVANGVKTVTGGGVHSLYLKTDGSLWAMGDNGWGQLGIGIITAHELMPVEVESSGMKAAAAGATHSLYVKETDGSLWAMGGNWMGQLGIGYTTSQFDPDQNPVPLPVKVSETEVVSNVVAVAAGFEHSLYIKADGSLWGMGYNGMGQLGRPDVVGLSAYAVQVESSCVVAVAAGTSHSLYVKEDGSLWAMGSNYNGQIGDGNGGWGVKQTAPIRIEISGVIAVAAGGYHSLYVKEDGSTWAMGFNDHGQLGDGTKVDRLSPVQIKGNGGVAASGGEYFSLYTFFIGSIAPILPLLLF